MSTHTLARRAEHIPSDLSFDLRLVHETMGRSRLKSQLIRKNPKLCQSIEARLKRESSLKKVEARADTGSIIIEYPLEESFDQDQLHVWLLEAHSESKLQPPSDAKSFEESLPLEWSYQSKRAILAKLKVNETLGLTSQEINERRFQFGSNDLEEASPVRRWEIFVRQFNNPQSLMLLASAGLSFVTGGLFDVIMIGGVVLVNGYISYISESHAEDIICSIGRIEAQEVRVIRDGQASSVLDNELVVGEIVKVNHGVVPADMRILEAKGLLVDESPLTGESMPVHKHSSAVAKSGIHSLSDRRNILYRGTVITSGQGLAVVVATGQATEIGRVRQLVNTTPMQGSLLQKDLNEIGSQTIKLMGLLCGSLFFIGLWRGSPFLDMLQITISLAVAAVPEGLPTIGTTTMALAVAQLQKRNILNRRLNVMETLGAVEILCLDKTGTLTMNEMVAAEAYFADDHWLIVDTLPKVRLRRYQDMTREDLPFINWALVASLCSDCEKGTKLNPFAQNWTGSSTEKAILHLVEHLGIDAADIQSEFPRFKVSYRTEERQYMTTYHTLDANAKMNLAAIKGNPEQLLLRCESYMRGKECIPLDLPTRDLLMSQNRKLGERGLRVLGFAMARGEDLVSIENLGLTWLGAVGLMDPTREGMGDLIEKFHRAGIRTIMMTGDQSETAQAVGIELGLNGHHPELKTLDARELKGLSLEEIAEQTESVQVFSRVSPSEKLKIVQALQMQGRIVAMTGDGINDSPALKAAHVGIAMGFQGTTAARESADIVLRDDNIQALYDAFEKGRAVRSNLRKSIQYLLATNLSEIILMYASIATGRGTPLNTIQLLWINLLSDILPGLALALDPPSADIMQRPPADPNEALLSLTAKRRLLQEALILSSGAWLSFELAKSSRQSQSPQTAPTQAFISLATSQLLHTLSVSAEPRGLLRGSWPKNHRIYVAMGIAAGAIGLGFGSSWFRRLLANEALTHKQQLSAIANGVWPVMFEEIVKLFLYKEKEQNVIVPLS